MDWCVLRTAGRHTLRLADTLIRDGYEAWTPIEQKTIHIPSKNVRRTVRLPIMPSYVFARAHQLIDLIQLADMPVKPRLNIHDQASPDFSVMHHGDRIPMIHDQHLNGLRYLEAKRTPRAKAQRLPIGMEVRVKTEGGSFAGMTGKVERSDEGMTLVLFDNRLSVKIATSLLSKDELGFASSLYRDAA